MPEPENIQKQDAEQSLQNFEKMVAAMRQMIIDGAVMICEVKHNPIPYPEADSSLASSYVEGNRTLTISVEEIETPEYYISKHIQNKATDDRT